MKKFKSLDKARKFFKGRKVKQGKACKMSDGSKGHWYSSTKKKK